MFSKCYYGCFAFFVIFLLPSAATSSTKLIIQNNTHAPVLIENISIYCSKAGRDKYLLGYLGDVLEVDKCLNDLEIVFDKDEDRYFSIFLKIVLQTIEVNVKSKLTYYTLWVGFPECRLGRSVEPIRNNINAINSSFNLVKLRGVYYVHFDFPFVYEKYSRSKYCSRVIKSAFPRKSCRSIWKGEIDSKPLGATIDHNSKILGKTKNRVRVCISNKNGIESVLIRKDKHVNKTISISKSTQKYISVSLDKIPQK